MKMKSNFYTITKSIGIFADETAFKKKYMDLILKDKDRFKTVFAIENSVEPGMPDLIVIDVKDRSIFTEVKYSKKGIITFKRTQIPWYRRNKHLKIFIIAYNDLTKNVHYIAASTIISKAQGTTFRLENENNFKIMESL